MTTQNGKASKAKKRSYHHGDLRSALLAASEKILESEGIQALTLRAAARAVGVSHTAPQNHFNDLTGLLSELAAVGYQRFCTALRDAAEKSAADTKDNRSKQVGKAYVQFARSHPGLFALMFRSEKLDAEHPGLRTAIDAARQVLRETSSPLEHAASPLALTAASVARWSLVHGFAVLLTEGRLSGVVNSLPGKTTADDLLDSVLDALRVDLGRDE